MKTNTHLLNMVTQILDARDKGDKPEEVRLYNAAIEEIKLNGLPRDLLGGRERQATEKLEQTLKLFTIR